MCRFCLPRKDLGSSPPTESLCRPWVVSVEMVIHSFPRGLCCMAHGSQRLYCKEGAGDALEDGLVVLSGLYALGYKNMDNHKGRLWGPTGDTTVQVLDTIRVQVLDRTCMR